VHAFCTAYCTAQGQHASNPGTTPHRQREAAQTLLQEQTLVHLDMATPTAPGEGPMAAGPRRGSDGCTASPPGQATALVRLQELKRDSSCNATTLSSKLTGSPAVS